MKYQRARREFIVTAEIRAVEEGGKKYLRGLIPYNSKSEDMGFIEIIAPGAFTKSIMESKQIFALWNHDDRQVLGNTANGTLKFEDTPAGLIPIVELNDTSYARDAWEQVQTGNVRTMSFGFSSVKEDYDYTKDQTIRYLHEVRLYEVSYGVPFPAYAETLSVAEVRSAFEKLNETEKDAIRKLLEPIIPQARTIDISANTETEKSEEPSTFDTRALDVYEAQIKLYKEILR